MNDRTVNTAIVVVNQDRRTSTSWAPPTVPQLPINTGEQARRIMEFAHHFEITTDEAFAWGRYLDGLTDEWPANYRRPGNSFFAHPAAVA